MINDTLTELDKKNAIDMVLIAVELLYEVKKFDWSVLNPINFQIITMCEFALPYYPDCTSLYAWLIKMYTKLGMVSLVTQLSETVYPDAGQPEDE